MNFLPKLFLATTAFFTLTFGTAFGQLVLQVDADANVFYLTGSDTGTPHDTGSAYALNWIVGSTGGGDVGVVGVASGFSNPSGISGSLLVYPGQNGMFLSLSNASSFSTITGSSSGISYGSFNLSQQNRLESFIGSSMTVSQGTGFSSVAVTAYSAVPEPSTWAVILGSCALVGALIKRRPRTGNPA